MDSVRMRTFDASVRASAFWSAVVIPPMVYGFLVWAFAAASESGPVNLRQFVGLLALAHGLPLAALGWMLCSVAAYSVAPGKLIEHRVVCDREFSLGPQTQVTQAGDGEIAVRLPRRTLRLRVAAPAECFDLLRKMGASASSVVAE